MFFARRFTTNFAPMVAPARALATSVQVADRIKIPVAPGPWGDMAKVKKMICRRLLRSATSHTDSIQIVSQLPAVYAGVRSKHLCLMDVIIYNSG